MTELVEKQAAIDALHKWEMVYTWDETCLEDREKCYAPSEVIEALPQAEPEIVRCKDCKHQEKFFHTDRRRKDGGYYIYGCELAEEYSHVCLDDDFCSRAERRTDDCI